MSSFLLGPDADVSEDIAYCLARAADEHNVRLIAWTVMSSYYEAVVNDPDGTLPKFLASFHRNVAKVLNDHYGRRESLWSAQPTCVARLVTYDDIFDKVVDVLANPVAERLVEHAADWPGLTSIQHMHGHETTHALPKYFRQPEPTTRRNRRSARHARREQKLMPETATLRAFVPEPAPGSAQETRAEWASRIESALEKREREHRVERGSDGVLGAEAVQKRQWTERETSEVEELVRRRRVSIVCADEVLREQASEELRTFYAEYAAARDAFVAFKNKETASIKLLSRDQTLEFPRGTYRLREWGASCAENTPEVLAINFRALDHTLFPNASIELAQNALAGGQLRVNHGRAPPHTPSDGRSTVALRDPLTTESR